mgnify:CR=1 FL=1
MEDLKKISECEQIEKMKQRKETIEKTRSYQKCWKEKQSNKPNFLSSLYDTV